VPTEDVAGCVCRPRLPWWWRSRVAVAVTAEMTYPHAVQGASTSRVAMLTLGGSTGSRGGGRRLRRGAGVVIEGRTGGRRGDSRGPPDCRPGLGWRGDAPRIGRRAGDGGGR
jgi:hypothetical protein